MKIRRKTNQCFNCGYTLDHVYNYCPNCGQENNDNNVSFGTLVGDFFSTYFAVDSTFGRSIKPFFFKPGFLTNRYIEGKRVSYAHPLRLYLIISLFYFFVFTMVGKKIVQDTNDHNIIENAYSLSNIRDLNKDTRKKLQKLIPEQTLTKMKDDLKGEDLEDLQKVVQDNLSEKDLASLKSELTPDELMLLGIFVPDSLLTTPATQDSLTVNDSTSTRKFLASKEISVNADNNANILSRIDWSLISKLKDNRDYSDEQILDSLKLTNLTTFEKHIAMQSIRVMRADNEQIVEYILKNLPLMMLILIPIFAFTLKILYIRKKNSMYINHLIHGLHLHSFAYLAYGIGLLFMIYMMEDEEIQGAIGLVTFAIVSTYAYFSFLRVYHQGWFKTLIKFNIVGFIYICFISIFFMGEMLLSMLLY
ncbi:DUF3667 domain-containing protein [Fulvivirga sp. 29W222]|uniref:DUF3667 domain-containing protein n=1 Tax=Fulvivirga marina TaxID=2494733 RepID=A0A937FVI8_9BACT|nr:DUF3667 domain-containing protein [Fulvivirga marina]MBL6445317.1 DUF3667 domain-containing protein [Fulvivirga marina]